jgi:hypothetical protein
MTSPQVLGWIRHHAILAFFPLINAGSVLSPHGDSYPPISSARRSLPLTAFPGVIG